MSLGDLAQLLRASSGITHHIDRANIRQQQASSSFHLKEVLLNNFISDNRLACHQHQRLKASSKGKKNAHQLTKSWRYNG